MTLSVSHTMSRCQEGSSCHVDISSFEIKSRQGVTKVQNIVHVGISIETD